MKKKSRRWRVTGGAWLWGRWDPRPSSPGASLRRWRWRCRCPGRVSVPVSRVRSDVTKLSDKQDREMLSSRGERERRKGVQMR